MELIIEAHRTETAPRSAAPAASHAATHRMPADGEFLTFKLGDEEYGIDILRVQEIRSYEQPTRIANAPVFVKGVVNLRGVIVPIIDLRLKLGCASAACNSFTVVVVLNVKGRVVGAVVDSVSDVLELSAAQIKPAPQLSLAVDTHCITGIATVRWLPGAGAGSAVGAVGAVRAVGAVGAVGGHDSTRERRLILMDIEALMCSAEMGLMNS